MRTFNLRLILALAGLFLVAAVSIHFIHGYQVRKNAGAYLLMARDQKDKVQKIIELRQGTQSQFKDAAMQAITFYKRYLSLQPKDDLPVRIEYATFLVEDLHDYLAAYAQNERILRATIDPSDKELFAKQLKIRETQIDLARAFQEYSDGVYHINELLKARPNDPKLLTLRGEYQLQLDDIAKNREAARKSLQLAIQYAPDLLPAYARLASVERERFKNRDAAEQVIEKMVAANPDNPLAYVLRAQFMLADTGPANQADVIQKKLLKDAVADCAKALQLDPKNLDARNILSVCNERLARLLESPDDQAVLYAKAKQQLLEVIALKPDVSSLYNRWSNLELLAGIAAGEKPELRLNAAEHAIREGIKAIADPKGNFELRWRLADLLMTSEVDREEVNALIKQLGTEQPDHKLVIYLEGRQLMTQQKWLDASKKFAQLRGNLQEYPDLIVRSGILLGKCYAQLGDLDQTLPIAQQAVKNEPTNVEARVSLANALAAGGRLTGAIKQYEAIVAMRPASLSYRKTYTELLLRNIYRTSPNKRDWRPALRQIDLIDRNASGDPWVPVMRAQVLASTDRLAEAEKILVQAREKDPNQQQFSITLLELAQRQGDAAKIQQRLSELEEKFGDTVDVRLVKARLAARQGGQQTLETLAALAKGVEQFTQKEQLRFYWNVAQVCFAIGAFDQGLQYGQEAAKLTPQNLRLRLAMLDIARMASNVPIAETLAQEIKIIEGGKAVSLYAQAMVDVTRYTAAVVAATAVDKKNGDAEQTATNAAKKKHAALLLEAQQHLDQAAELRDGWADIPALQGTIASYQGNLNSATAYFRQAIDLGNRDPNLAYQVVLALARKAQQSTGSDRRDALMAADAIVRKLEEQRSNLPLNLGRLASKLSFDRQDYGRALDLARPLARAGESLDQLYVGIVAMALGSYDEAETSLRSAAKTAPENDEVWRALVRCLALAGKKAQAKEAMDEALAKVKPETRDALHAACLELLGDLDQAVAVYREAIKAKDASPALLQTAAQFFLSVPIAPPGATDDQQGVDPSVRQEGTAILARFVDGDLAIGDLPPATRQWARYDLARVLGAQGYPGFLRAIKLLDQNLDEDPASVDDKRLRARLMFIYGQRRQRTEAINVLQQLADQPKGLDFESRFLLAQQYLAHGNFDKYREEMFRLISLADKSSRLSTYMAHYVNALLRYGDRTIALGIAKTLQKKRPNEIASVLVRANALARALVPRADEALRIVKQAVDDPRVAPKKKTAKMLLVVPSLEQIAALLDARLAELSRAKTIKTDSEQIETLSEIRDRLVKQVKPESARIARIIRKQVDPIETTTEEYFNAIVAEDKATQLIAVPHMQRVGKLHEAVKLVEQHWQSAAPATLALACGVLLDSGRLETLERESIESLVVQAVEKYAGTDEVLPLRRTLANFYVKQMQFGEAIEQYEEIIARRETDAAALNNLSMLMATEKDADLSQALTYIAKAIQMVGPQPMLLDSQAMIQLAAGKTKEALATLQRVVDEKPENVTPETNPTQAKRWGGYYFHLALALQASQEMAKVKEAMNKSRALGFGESDVFDPELERYRQIASQ